MRRLTSLPAENLGLDRRGLLEAGYFADVVVFDPATIADQATFEKPHQYASGVRARVRQRRAGAARRRAHGGAPGPRPPRAREARRGSEAVSTRRIAVTGANGFIGRHVVRHAAASGYEVAGIVRSEPAAQVVSGAGGSPVQLVGRDPEALVRALDGCSAVVHLAQIGAERVGRTTGPSTSATPSASSRTAATSACRASCTSPASASPATA